MANSDFLDLSIQVDNTGAIDSVRGMDLPGGILYVPAPPNTKSLISVVAMQTMSAALVFALDVQKRALDQAALEPE